MVNPLLTGKEERGVIVSQPYHDHLGYEYPYRRPDHITCSLIGQA